MMDIVLVMAVIVGLMLLRSLIQHLLQGLVLLMGGSKYQGIVIYSLLFLPGVIIHEMSHFLTAAILGVQTGEITIFPKRDDDQEGERIALGTVKVAKTDFLRGSLIGAAPFFIGSVVLFFSVRYFLEPLQTTLVLTDIGSTYQLLSAYFLNPANWLGLYLVFTVANTMFVSREDARAFPVVAVLLILTALVVGISGKSSQAIYYLIPRLEQLARFFLGSFSAALILDMTIAGVLILLVKSMEKLTKRRLVYGKRRLF
jgi:hypothetical protein